MTHDLAQSSDAPLQIRTENRVRWLTLNQPEQRNPLSSTMLRLLREALADAAEDREVRAVVIAAQGPVFCAGHDLKEMGRQADESADDQAARVKSVLESCAKTMLSIVHSPRAIIACVQGTATAAGCQLVSASDLAVAADFARFCTPGVNIGGFCTTPLVGIGRNIHRKHAMAMALTGDSFSARDAERFGLVNEVVPAADLLEHTKALAERIASKSAEGIREGKADFYRQVEMPLEEAFTYANDAMLRAMITEDSKEGVQAFFEKRSPEWRDV
ncbi:MAG: enoyl-CoA hydratase [Congregibacter sp.]